MKGLNLCWSSRILPTTMCAWDSKFCKVWTLLCFMSEHTFIQLEWSERTFCIVDWLTACGGQQVSAHGPILKLGSDLCVPVPMSPCTDVSLYRCATIPMCHRTDVSPYRCVPVPMCHCTDVSLYQCLPVPMCPLTYMFPYVCVPVLMCPCTDMFLY